MFAIKVIEESGSEYVRPEVEGVRFNPPISETGKQSILFVFYKDSPGETIYSGQVYVMNENGKTIANYHLDRYPQGLDKTEA